MESKHYYKDDLVITWKPKTCMHSANCVKKLHAVFNPQAKPWIDTNNASKEEIMAAIDACPSGALSYATKGAEAMADDSSSTESEATVLHPKKNGPLIVKGNLTVVDDEGNVVKQTDRAVFCRCGQSGKQPFCDGSHNRVGFIG
jgi:uncharacterized Fe-S cluster protein YjdI